MFRATSNIQIASMMCENEAFVRCILQIPRVEDVKKTLSCKASVKFQELSLKLSEHVFNACPEQMQNTIGQHHPRKETVTLNSVTLRAQSELDCTLKR